MLCLLFFIYWEGRLRKAAKMARAAPFPFVYILERRRRRSEERHKQNGERGTAKRRASCFLCFYLGKATAPIRRAARADQKSRPRRSEEPLVQGGERGTAKRRASCFLYIGKDACAKRRKWHGLRRSPSFYYFVNVSRPYRQAISGRTRAAMTAARTPRRMSLLPGRNTQPTSVAQTPTSLCRYNSAMRK